MRDSRETIRAFVTGYPVGHSRSPLIHGHWLRHLGIDGSYQAIEVAPEDFAGFMGRLKSGDSGYAGGNVTIPHKENAYRLADRPDEIAEELGAANTLYRRDGLIYATNTDGRGFLANLDQRHPGWAGEGGKAIVYGAGGAARAIVQAVRDRGFSEIHVLNRTLSRAVELGDRFGPRVHAHPMEVLPELLPDARLFVNTTSLGMDGTAVPEIDFTAMAKGAVVTDIVYVPLVTPMLAMARRQGLAIVDGLGMLLHQAVPGFELWFGQRPVVDETLRAMIIADMDRH